MTAGYEHMDGAANVSKAGRNYQWVNIGAEPTRLATYSSVVSPSTPVSSAHHANAKCYSCYSETTA